MSRRSVRREESLFVVEGAVLIAEALRAGWDVIAQYVAGDTPAVAHCDAPVFALGEGVLERIASTGSPQPNLALVSLRTASLARLAPDSDATERGDVYGDSQTPWVLFLDAVSDPGNLGTILRSAEAMGARGVVLGAGCVDPFNPKVVRASAGALFNVPFVEGAALAEIKLLGYRIMATSSHGTAGSQSLSQAQLDGAVCVVLGNEAHGVTPAHAAFVDGWITIDHVGRAESLNVAMAATIISYEMARVRA